MHTENSTEPGNKVTDWLGDADDWGDEDGDIAGCSQGESGDPNGNPLPDGPTSTPSTPSPVGATGYQNNFNINSLTLDPLTLDSGNGNANSPVKKEDSRGAHGGAQATVEEDGEEEGCVAMEEIEQPATDIPSLFFVANRPSQSTSGELRIAPHYLWVGEETEGSNGKGEILKDEERLLQEYKAREALEVAMGQVGKGGDVGKGGSGGEGWEKVIPSHGDEMLHKMVEVIQRNPGQVSFFLSFIAPEVLQLSLPVFEKVLRYTRQCGVSPLLLQPIQETKIPCCRYNNQFLLLYLLYFKYLQVLRVKHNI